MKTLAFVLIATWSSLLLNPIPLSNGDAPSTSSSHSRVADVRQELGPSDKSSNTKPERSDNYQQALEQLAATKSMQQLHANYAQLGSPFQEMTTVQFADLFHRSQGFSLPGTREVRHNMYLHGWNSEIPILADPEPDDCTPEEIEAWYRKFYDPWNAKRPAPSPWTRELPFVEPRPHQRVQPGFTVINGRGYRWGIVWEQNARGDYEAVGQLQPDFKPEPHRHEK